MRWEWGRGRRRRSFHEWGRLGIGWKCVLFCEWGPARGIQLQAVPDVAAAARSPIHKTGSAVRRGGEAWAASLLRVKVFLGAPRRTRGARGGGTGGGAEEGSKGSSLNSWMNSTFPSGLNIYIL